MKLLRGARRSLLVLSIGFSLYSSPGRSESGDYQLDFGPMVGSGSLSTGEKVRSSNGYALSLERNWQAFGSGFYLGPRVELSNSFVTAKKTESDVATVANYDHRVLAAGLTLSHAVGHSGTFAQRAYASAVVGRGYSKLTIDETGDRTYRQSLFGSIDGNYFAGELGGWIPLKDNLGIHLAVVSAIYRANQSKATCTFEGNQLNSDGQLSLIEGTETSDALPSTVVFKTNSLKLGLALTF